MGASRHEEGTLERREGKERRRYHPMRLLRGLWTFVGKILRGILLFFRSLFRWIFIALGVVFATIALTLFGGLYAPELINALDLAYPEFVDRHVGTDRFAPTKLRDPRYYAEQTEIFGADGSTRMSCISSPEHRIKFETFEEIPPSLRYALVASEDKSFWEHDGVDMRAIYRAAFKTLIGESSSGASTITMQVGKELRNGVGRRSTKEEKLQDIVTALRLERVFTKEQLLLRYANMPYFGRGQYGVESASRSYFGRSASQLSLHQAAFIASLINKPALPDRKMVLRVGGPPQTIREGNWGEVAAGTRRVLERMFEDGYISSLEFARASDAIDNDLRNEIIMPSAGCGVRDYFLESVRVSYADRFPLNTGGLTLAVTRDDELQKVLTETVSGAVRTHLARYPDDPDNAHLRAAAIAVRFDGAVLAEVGNIDFSRFKYNVIRQGHRQPGSTFKIFTYGGLAEHLVTKLLAPEKPPQTLDALTEEVLRSCRVLDAPVGVSLGRGRGVHIIQNFHSRNAKTPRYWGMMTCVEALGRSQNTAAIRAGQQAGIKNIIELAYRLGMPKDEKHPLQPYPTTAIGASEINPLGMVGTIAFLNGGYKVTPRYVNDLCKDGRSLISKDENGISLPCDLKGERRNVPERVLHPAVSLVMTEVLRGPVEDPYGTVKSLRRGVIPFLDPLGSEVWKLSKKERDARVIVFPEETSGQIAGKTGTATNADGRTSDVWLILYVPGPAAHPEQGVMLLFWMGKDSKDHALGTRGRLGGGQAAETGGRNWTHAAATVLKFLQEKRGLLQPGNAFRPVYQDGVLLEWEHRKKLSLQEESGLELPIVVDPFDVTTDPVLLEELNNALVMPDEIEGPPLPDEEQISSDPD